MKFQQMFKGIRCRPPSVSSPTELPPPDKVLISMDQHPGRVCDPSVEPGHKVKAGQAVGIDRETHQPAVFATIDGTVESIVKTYDTKGKKVAAVAIKADGPSQSALPLEVGLPVIEDSGALAEVKQDALLDGLDSAGLYLTPSCGPRPYVTMNGVEMIRGIKHLIIKCVDMDPPVAPNHACLLMPTTQMELGIAALAHASLAQQVLIAVPAGGSSAELSEMARRNGWNLVQVNVGHFPYCQDNFLINNLTGKTVTLPDGDPRDMGVVIHNLRAALEVGQVLMSGLPQLDHIVTVAGDDIAPQSFKVRLGTPIGQLVEAAGGLKENPGKVLLGGPMMGYAQFDLNAPVTKQTDGIYIQSAENMRSPSSHPCINCGRCVDVCPSNLLPGELSKLCEFADYETAAERDLFNCMECGCCAYVCPAQRPIVQLIRLGKSEILAKGMEQ